MPYVCESRFRVRYAETDQMGMVYYANYERCSLPDEFVS
jgi:acyl-CoA thioesterase FadM